MANPPRPILHLKFANSATATPSADPIRPIVKRPARDTSPSDPAMRGYMINLESRLLLHVQRHAKSWVARETGDILRRWNAPILRAPAPRWAPPRDVAREARRFAEELVMERIKVRLMQFHELRQARGFVHDPLGDRLRAVYGVDLKATAQRHKQRQ